MGLGVPPPGVEAAANLGVDLGVVAAETGFDGAEAPLPGVFWPVEEGVDADAGFAEVGVFEAEAAEGVFGMSALEPAADGAADFTVFEGAAVAVAGTAALGALGSWGI